MKHSPKLKYDELVTAYNNSNDSVKRGNLKVKAKTKYKDQMDEKDWPKKYNPKSVYGTYQAMVLLHNSTVERHTRRYLKCAALHRKEYNPSDFNTICKYDYNELLKSYRKEADPKQRNRLYVAAKWKMKNGERVIREGFKKCDWKASPEEKYISYVLKYNKSTNGINRYTIKAYAKKSFKKLYRDEDFNTREIKTNRTYEECVKDHNNQNQKGQRQYHIRNIAKKNYPDKFKNSDFK